MSDACPWILKEKCVTISEADSCVEATQWTLDNLVEEEQARKKEERDEIQRALIYFNVKLNENMAIAADIKGILSELAGKQETYWTTGKVDPELQLMELEEDYARKKKTAAAAMREVEDLKKTQRENSYAFKLLTWQMWGNNMLTIIEAVLSFLSILYLTIASVYEVSKGGGNHEN